MGTFYHCIAFLLLTLAALPVQATGQPGEYFEPLPNEHLLHSSYINTLCQDQYDRIWIGTEYGLNYFDGYDIYSHSLPGADTLFDSWPDIQLILADSNSNLWILTSRGVVAYNLETQQHQWQRIMVGNTAKYPLYYYHLTIHQSSIYLLTDAGCFIKNMEEPAFRKLELPPMAIDGMENMEIDRDGRFWLCNTQKIVLHDPKQNKTRLFKHSADKPEGPGALDINGIFIDSQGTAWFALSSGLNRFDREKAVFNRFEGVGGVFSMVEDPEGYFWLATWEDGLCRFDPRTGEVVKHRNKKEDPFSISSNSLRCLIRDNYGNIWTGTNGNGVTVLKNNYWKFRHYQQSATNPYGLNNNNIRCFAHTTGKLWIGTENGGLNCLDRATGKFSHYFSLSDQGIKRVNSVVLAICEDNTGRLWIGTLGGLHIFAPGSQGYRYAPVHSMPESLPQIWTITKDDAGMLWLGTNIGLVSFNPETRTSKTFHHSPNQPGSLSDDRIPAIMADSPNELWVGTKNGLNKVDLRTMISQRYFHQTKDTNSLPGNQINHIFKARDNTIWVSTNYGLARYNRAKDCFVRIPTNQWPSQVILGMVEDNNQLLWISTQNGILNYTPAEQTFTIYDYRDGLQGNKFSAGAFYAAPNGELFFGGTNGFNSFFPSSIIKNPTPPKVIINKLIINNDEMQVGALHSPLKKWLPYLNELTLSYNQNTFSLGFLAINYLHTQKNQYAYILEGFDEGWVYCNDRRMAYYTNVPHGKYRFRVKACNNDGVWDQQGVSLDLVIRPPLWASWWARIMYAIIPLILLYFFRKYSIIAVEAKNQMLLDRVEKEKVKELYNMKIRFFMNISHEFRTPLTLIIDPIENVMKQLEENSPIRKTLTLSHRNAIRMLNLINQLLEFRKIETGNVSLHVSELEIVGFINEIATSFKEKAEQKQIQFEVRANPDVIQVWCDPDKLEKILYNLLSNAFKFTASQGRISVLVSVEKRNVPNRTKRFGVWYSTKEQLRDFVRIEIEDTGRGISPAHIDRIFERFYQIESPASQTQKGTGIGLALTKDLVDLHHGNIEVKSIENIGSRFVVFLPLGKDHFSPGDLADTTTIRTSPYLTGQMTEQPQVSDNETEPADIQPHENLLLFVDDNADIVTYVKLNLSSAYNILVGTNGREGLDLALKHLPDLIITDVMMPEMDGIELTRALKNNDITRHIPIVLLTARTAAEAQHEALTEGATDYITKPFSIQLLELKIRNILADRKILQDKNKKNIFAPSVDIKYDSADETFLKKLVDLIEKNISEPNFEVETIVGQIGMSRAQLYRKLNSLTGQSVKEFVRNIRIRSAAKLLEKGDLRINEVMTLVGINNRAYFIQCFKEQYGVNPSEYKKSS